MEYNSIEKHEIHCAKRYLEYIETEHYRAFRDKTNPDCFDVNFAVLKRCDDADATFAAVEAFYAWRGEQPVSFKAAPDAVPIVEATRVFSQHGYEIKPYHTTRMLLTAAQDAALQILPCKTRCIEGALTWPERPLIKESFDGQAFGLRLVDTQMKAGAKAFFAYNKAGVPVSFCMGEGYGSAFSLSDVYTPVPCRGQGCATAVVAAALRYAKNEGYTDVFLYVDEKAVARLYKKLGFRGRQAEQYWACRGTLPAWIKTLP